MNYTVDWHKTALDQLAELWMAAADRNAVAEASDRIDDTLARDPMDAGEGRDGDERILFDRPLCVLFWVNQTSRSVLVVEVGLASRRS